MNHRSIWFFFLIVIFRVIIIDIQIIITILITIVVVFFFWILRSYCKSLKLLLSLTSLFFFIVSSDFLDFTILNTTTSRIIVDIPIVVAFNIFILLSFALDLSFAIILRTSFDIVIVMNKAWLWLSLIAFLVWCAVYWSIVTTSKSKWSNISFWH